MIKKIKLFAIIGILLCCSQTPLFAKSLHNCEEITQKLELLKRELDDAVNEKDPKKAELHLTALKLNVHLFEICIHKRIHRIEDKLLKYKTELSSCMNAEEQDLLLSKIVVNEERIKNLHDLLFTLDLWKSKVSH